MQYKGTFPDSSVVENPPANAGTSGSVPGSGRSPGEGNGYPVQYSCLENSLGQWSLEGYSPWGHKERTGLSDRTTGNKCPMLRA